MINKPQSKIKNVKSGLYIVSTPIGNLEDITFRAVEILRKSDFILCEDTRVSKNLLNRYEIKSKLISNHKFNEKKNLNEILSHLRSGKIISLISDAGTPSISDPGAILINACIEEFIDIIPIPGPSALAAAVSVSGFSDKFLFYGFFPEKKKELSLELNRLSKIDNSLVFFVSLKKINKIIPEIKKNFSGRKIVFCREITKFYEEFIRKNVDELELFKENLKGECTVVISDKKNNKIFSQKLSESDKLLIKKMINKFSIKEISKVVSQNTNVSKKDIYSYCLKLKNEN